MIINTHSKTTDLYQLRRFETFLSWRCEDFGIGSLPCSAVKNGCVDRHHQVLHLEVTNGELGWKIHQFLWDKRILFLWSVFQMPCKFFGGVFLDKKTSLRLVLLFRIREAAKPFQKRRLFGSFWFRSGSGIITNCP